VYLCDPAVEWPSGGPPIGQPLPNFQCYVVDANLQPQPIGVPGELLVGGAGVARGYLNRPELTAERFIPRAAFLAQIDPRRGRGPASNSPDSQTVYRTGDLVRWLPSGELEFLGRIDDQVKVRGFRIELGEIEAVLREHPRVRDAVAIVREDVLGDKRIVAYLVRQESAEPADAEAADWRAFARGRLPEYMIPSAFVLVDALPITPAGKVDRLALRKAPLPNAELDRQGVQGTEYIAPRDPLETQLTATFEELLGVHGIGVRDNFFELGGHSLLAVKLVARIGAYLGVPLPLAPLFEQPTVEHLAAVIREQYLGAFQASLVPIKPDGDRPALFFIHPSGGSVHWYYDLAQRLPEDRPLYGLQAHGLMGDAPLDETVEAMAARYVAEIREAQPDGPYHIASWSMGVAIALEVGQQLLAQGAEMGLLVVVDQGPVSPIDEPEDDAEYLLTFFGKRMPVSLEYLRTLEGDEQLRYVMEEAKRIEWLFKDVTFAQFKQFVRVLKVHSLAWRNYRPATYDGRVLVFRASEREMAPGDPADLGWGALAGERVEVVETRGNHNTILHDYVDEFAAALLPCVAAAENAGITGASDTERS
jgi:thioesterase domain-containing protein